MLQNLQDEPEDGKKKKNIKIVKRSYLIILKEVWSNWVFLKSKE